MQHYLGRVKSKRGKQTHIAFLRAINVGGRYVKMQVLVKIFSDAGFEHVRTFIQSGNILFEAKPADPGFYEKKIEALLPAKLGYEVSAMVRTLDEVEAMLKSAPFRKYPADAKVSVAFFSAAPTEKMKMPLFSPKKDVEVVSIKGSEAFCIHHLVNGKWGYPNQFLEKTFGVRVTVRFPSMLEELVIFGRADREGD